MLPSEIQAAIAGNQGLTDGYQRMLQWIAGGGQHGSYAGLIPNEAVVRSAMTPWGENIQYDAAGNEVSFYRAPRPGEISPYQGPAGPSAPEYDPVASRNAPVPWGFTSKGIAGQAQPAGWNGYSRGASGAAPAGSSASPSLTSALALAGLPSQWTTPTDQIGLLPALAQPKVETEAERQARLLKEQGYGANLG